MGEVIPLSIGTAGRLAGGFPYDARRLIVGPAFLIRPNEGAGALPVLAFALGHHQHYEGPDGPGGLLVPGAFIVPVPIACFRDGEPAGRLQELLEDLPSADSKELDTLVERFVAAPWASPKAGLRVVQELVHHFPQPRKLPFEPTREPRPFEEILERPRKEGVLDKLLTPSPLLAYTVPGQYLAWRLKTTARHPVDLPDDVTINDRLALSATLMHLRGKLRYRGRPTIVDAPHKIRALSLQLAGEARATRVFAPKHGYVRVKKLVGSESPEHLQRNIRMARKILIDGDLSGLANQEFGLARYLPMTFLFLQDAQTFGVSERAADVFGRYLRSAPFDAKLRVLAGAEQLPASLLDACCPPEP